MLRNIINGIATSEIYKAGAEVVRGVVVVKDYSAKTVGKADSVGVEVFFVDKDHAPTGAFSDTEVSDYTTEAETVAANELCIVKQLTSGTWATDQVDATGLTAGDYLIAGATTNVGKLVKAVSTNVSTMKYVGTVDDGGNTLYAFEIVPQHTVA